MAREAGSSLVLLVAAFALTTSPGEAACAAPTTTIDVHRAAPGDVIEVTGEYWAAECNDVISCTSGCGVFCTGGEPSPPTTDITIELMPVGKTPGRPRVLAEGVAADEAFEFSLEVTLPDDLAPGRYEVVASSPRSLGVSEPTEPFRVTR